MKKCISCNSTNTERSKNDSGHFKSPSQKPFRVYQWHCKDCGFIGMYKDGENNA